MKKFIVIFLILIMLCIIVFPLSACDKSPSYKYVFITDLHVIASSVFNAENYSSFAQKDKMIHLTEAILNSFADEVIKKKYKYVLIGGDLTENGDEESHLACAKAFAKMEKKGVNVFVINGNHDLSDDKGKIDKRITNTRFKEIYQEFGYKEAISISPNTLSYTAELGKGYRLLAIDSMVYYGDDAVNTKSESMSESHCQWLKTQIDKCNADKVMPIVITHDDFLNHFPAITEIVANRFNSEQYEKFVSYFTDNGGKTIFAGHNHINDIISYTSAKGNTIYEAETGSMAFYPCAYREFNLKKKNITISTVYFDKLKQKYLPPCCPEEMKTELEKGLQEYCWNHYYDYVYRKTSEGADFLSEIKTDKKLTDALQIVKEKIADKVLNNPFYEKDENNNISLERILKQYGITIPETLFKNIPDLAPYMASKLFSGNENMAGAGELDLIKYSIYAIFYYIQQSAQDIAAVLPSLPVINLDLQKLFAEGVLECYDSNFVPFALEILKIINSDVSSIVSGFVSENFDDLNCDLIKALLKPYKLESIIQYFAGKEILLGKLIDEGIWDNLASDYVTDTPPSDTYLEIPLK